MSEPTTAEYPTNVDYSEPNIKGQLLTENAKLRKRLEAAEATLKTVAELPDDWQNIDSRFDTSYRHAKRGCAKELKAVLEAK